MEMLMVEVLMVGVPMVEVLMVEVLMVREQMGEVLLVEVLTEEGPMGEVLTEQASMEEPMEEVTAALKWVHANFETSDPAAPRVSLFIIDIALEQIFVDLACTSTHL